MSERVGGRSGLRARIRAFAAEAMLREAEADLDLHRARGHRLRAYLARRRLERLNVDDSPLLCEAGRRVETYIRVGARG